MSVNGMEAAFNWMISIQGRDVVLNDLKIASQVTVKAAPSNYFRNLEAPSDMVVQGLEFVISKKELDDANFVIKRGVYLIDSDSGTKDSNLISEVRPMTVFGKVVGYRVRTS